MAPFKICYKKEMCFNLTAYITHFHLPRRIHSTMSCARSFNRFAECKFIPCRLAENKQVSTLVTLAALIYIDKRKRKKGQGYLLLQ
jgi:hypothetical protein